MKSLLVLVLAFGSLLSFAEKPKDDGRFEERKAKLSTHLDKRIAALQESKSCISNAKDDKGLKACHEKMKEHRKERRESMREMRREKKHKHHKEE